MYFDWSATSLIKPLSVIDALVDGLTRYGNPSRGAYPASMEALELLYNTRSALAQFMGVGDPSRVAFTQNATMALNIAIGSLSGPLVTTAAEHNSVLRPVYLGGNYTVVPVDSKGRLDYDELEAALRPGTGGLVITHASNLTGGVNDLGIVGRLCQEKNIPLVVDASQSAGLLPIQMDALGISALCFSGHKSLYGPMGTGALCTGANFHPRSLLVGGSGIHSFDQTHPTAMPEVAEAGTQNVHGISGLLAGVRYVSQGMGRFLEEATQRAAQFIAGASQIPQITFYGDLSAETRTPVVALNLGELDSAELAFQLAQRQIDVRAGAHCAPLMHRALGTENQGAVRFSFSHLNTWEEVDLAVAALAQIAKEHGFPR